MPLPGFLIHPLVENAIKHGMQTSQMPLRVKVIAERTSGGLYLEVANTGSLQPADESMENSRISTGTGISNLRERLKLLFPGQQLFTISEEEGWVRAIIEIPEKISSVAPGDER